MHYHVHAYVPVRVLMDIEADSVEEACEKAAYQDLHHHIDRSFAGGTIQEIEWDDSEHPLSFLIDEAGDDDHERSVWRWSDGQTPRGNVPRVVELLMQLLFPANQEPDRKIIKDIIKSNIEKLPTWIGLDKELDGYIQEAMKYGDS